MIRKLLLTIKDGWYHYVFETIEMSVFFKRILTVYNILDVFELDKNSTVVLYGKNSYNWIAIYLACLLKGVRLLIIHPKTRIIEVIHIMTLTNVNHVFIDGELIHSQLSKNVFLKTLIDIDSLRVVFEKGDKTMFTELAAVLTDAESTHVVSLQVLDTLFEEREVKSSVITATSGTEFGQPKWVESSTDSINSLITKAFNAIKPYDEGNTVYSKVPFAESHIVTVLLPFLKGCIFVGSKKSDVDVYIENTTSIEEMWRRNVNPLYDNKILSPLFTIPGMRWFFKFCAIRKVREYYGRNVEAIIVYNNTMNDEMLSMLVGKLPIYTTYGSQETNQLVAINDYSSKEKRLLACVGTALPGIVLTSNEGELEISSSTLFTKYIGDEVYTNEVRYRDSYITGDVCSINLASKVAYVHGRLSAVRQNEFKMPIQLDEMERTIKAIPYIEDAIIISRDEKLYLLVYLDRNFAEIKKIGYIRAKELFKVYLNKINLVVSEQKRIEQVVILSRPFIKTPDDKICRHFYG